MMEETDRPRDPEARWRTVLESAYDHLLFLDLEGRVLYLNRAAPGYPVESVVGKLVFDVVVPEAGARLREAFERAHTTRKPAEYELSRPGPEGEVRHIEGRFVPDLRGGELVGFTVIARDVTESRRVEQELRFAGEIMQATPVGLLVWRLEDREDLESFRLVAGNRAAESMTGIPVTEILGRRMREIFPNLHDTPLPEACRKIILEGVEKDLGEIQYGDERVARNWFSVKAFPLPGDAVGVAFESVTQRVRAEEALRLSEQRFRSLLANLPNVAWTCDIEGRSTYISPNIERIYGYTPEEVIAEGTTFWISRIHPDDRDMVQGAYRALFEEHRPFNVEYRIRHKNGNWVWFLDQALATYERDGRWYADGIFSEVTERKSAEARLAAEHAVTRVLAEAQSLESAAPGVLRAIAESLGCAVAALWRIRTNAGELVCEYVWRHPGIEADAFDSACRTMTFNRGAGLPGRVWGNLGPSWIPDAESDANFPRKEAAIQSGLRSGFAFPIQAGGDLFGVMEFFKTQLSSPDPALVNMAAAIGSEIGQFVRRKEAEEALRHNEAETRAVLDAALDAVVGMDGEGKIVSWNPRAEAIFGWARVEAIGRKLGELIVPEGMRERHREGLERFLRTSVGTMLNRRIEMMALRRNGSEFPIELSLTARQSDEGWRFNAFVADITERKRADRERSRLLESEKVAREDAERALERLRAIHSITDVALAHLSLDDLLGVLLGRLRSALGSDSATVLLLEDSQQSLVVRASDGLEIMHDGRPMRIPLNRGVSGKVAASGEPTIVDDIEEVEVLSDYFRAHVRSLIAVPLVVEGKVIGVLHAGSSKLRRFVREDLHILQLVAYRMAPAIEQVRLLDEVREGRTRLRELSNRLVELQESERREMARELHDEIGQLLTGLKLLLESDERRARPAPAARTKSTKRRTAGKAAGMKSRAAPRAKAASGNGTPSAYAEQAREQMMAVVNDLMGRVRELSMNLRPAMLDDLGLLPALLWLFERYQAQTGVKVVFRHSGLEGRFPTGVETAAFRITQEALTNAARHSQAPEVQVEVRVDNGRLRLQINDQGKGFSTQLEKNIKSSGLTGMNERARLLGGSLVVQSSPGKGTSIKTEIPVLSRERGEP
jgi:PAS domain S-box-containing protein